MAKVDKNATPAYETVGNKIKRHMVKTDEFEKEALEQEKERIEQRLTEINEILGGING